MADVGDPESGSLVAPSPWRAGWPVGEPDLCQQVLLDDPYGRILVDPTGRIVLLNPSASRLLDRPPEELLGQTLATFLTPSSIEIAVRIFTEVAAANDRDIPVDLEILRPDGTIVAVEVGGHRYLDDPVHQGVHLRLRPRDRQRWIEVFLTELVHGSSLDSCLDPLARAFDAAVPGAHTVVLYERDGLTFGAAAGPSVDPGIWVAGRAWPEELTDPRHLPWLRVLETNEVHVAAIDDLPPHLRAAALDAGYATCWAFPVTVPPDHQPSATVVLWRSEPGPPRLGQALAVSKLCGLVALAIERNRSHLRLVRAATHDSLTALLNREALVSRLGRSLDEATDDGVDPRLAVLYLDLDRFKPINDRYGHRFGDDLLVLVGQRLLRCLRASDDIARVGGDEFVVVCRDMEEEGVLHRVADALLVSASEPFVLEGTTVEVGISVGMAVAPEHGRTPVDLIDAADRGLYLAKHAGRSCVRMAPPGEAHPRGRPLRRG